MQGSLHNEIWLALSSRVTTQSVCGAPKAQALPLAFSIRAKSRLAVTNGWAIQHKSLRQRGVDSTRGEKVLAHFTKAS
jgi:hypothetical protein